VRANARTVDFTVISAWRSDFTGSANRGPDITLRYGDGGSKRIYPFENTILYDADGYKLTSVLATRTYSSGGIRVVSFDDCCRIDELVNSGGSSFSVISQLELLPGLQSPVLVIPVILQVQQNSVYSQYIPAVKTSGGTVPCSNTGSGEIDEPPQINGNSPYLEPDPCRIVWDTTGGSLGDLYAWQVTYRQPSANSFMNVDFMMEVADGLPTCSFADGSAGQYTAMVGNTLSIGMTVDDPNDQMITLSTIPSTLPSTMAISPGAGWTVASPVLYTFTYTPIAADIGTGSSIASLFKDPDGGTCVLVLGITVVAPPPPPPPRCVPSLFRSQGTQDGR
jgi:hypothetical protein